MTKRFTRNIRSIENIEKQPKYTNEQNDLLSDDRHVYVRNKDQYEQITGGVKEVNGETPDSGGSVEIDTGVHKVNGKDPDEQGNIEVDTGVKTVTNVAPDENGNVDLQIKDFKEQEKLVRKNQLDEALEDIESGYKNYTDRQIKLNDGEIEKLKTNTETNTSDIGTLQTNVSTNTNDIDTLQKDVSTNTNDIDTLQKDVSTNTSEIKTLNTSTDNIQSEISNLKTTFNNFKILLYEGSASNKGDVIKLNQAYTDFTELKIKISRTGGKEILNFDAEDNSAMSINIANIYDDNSDIKLYEMTIDKNSSTELEITGERSKRLINPSSSDESGITILKVWGVK